MEGGGGGGLNRRGGEIEGRRFNKFLRMDR